MERYLKTLIMSITVAGGTIAIAAGCTGGDDTGGAENDANKTMDPDPAPGGSGGGGSDAGSGNGTDTNGSANGSATAATNGTTNGTGGSPSVSDADNDGFSVEEGDCDDHNPAIHPEAKEIPLDGVDQDCTGLDRGNCPDCIVGSSFPLGLDYYASGCDGIFSAEGFMRGTVEITEDAVCGGFESVTVDASVSARSESVSVTVQMNMRTGCGRISTGSYASRGGSCASVTGAAYLNSQPTCRSWPDSLLCPDQIDGGSDAGLLDGSVPDATSLDATPGDASNEDDASSLGDANDQGDAAPDPDGALDGGSCPVSIAGKCWYYGGGGESCASVCAAHGGYDEATATFAAATDENCSAVGAAFGLSEVADSSTCAAALGCTTFAGAGSSLFRCTNVTATASQWDARRLCACAN